MATKNASDNEFTNNADGFSIAGGTTKRTATVTGADITLTGSGSNTHTFPASSDTLVGRASTDTLTNKTLTSPKLNEDVVVTTTATELNTVHSSGITNADLIKLHAVTSSATELNYVDITTPGTAEASKALITDANKDVNLGTGDITATIGTLTSLSFPAPQGFLINGKIVPSVASNNLTVAIKGLDGNDPSATNPVYCRIGDTVRSITAALSVTKNAGTNWCNSGSAELATKEIDYFVYLGYNATDGVVIGFSRIPYARSYGEFSATSTNEKYCAISTITSAASTDYYEIIGRFAATLSAGAGYTWTVPTFTAINLIQRPIRNTRALTWTPTYTGFSSDPTNIFSRYIVREKTCEIWHNEAGNGTSNSADFNVSLPFSIDNTSYYRSIMSIRINDNGSTLATPGVAFVDNSLSASSLFIRKDFTGTGFTTSGAKSAQGIQLKYLI